MTNEFYKEHRKPITSVVHMVDILYRLHIRSSAGIQTQKLKLFIETWYNINRFSGRELKHKK